MSLSVFLFRGKLLAGPHGSKLLGCATKARRLHDGKTEIFDNTVNFNLHPEKLKHVHNIDLVNRKFFSGTTQSGDESTYQKIERHSFKALAKGENWFGIIRHSNEMSVVKAVGRKACRTLGNIFRKNVWENDRVMAIRKDIRQKYEQAREQESRK